MKEFAIYTALRLGLFLGAFVVAFGVWALLAAGEVPLLWPLLIAMVVSAVGSAYLLKGPRQRFAARIEKRAALASARFEAMRSKEDVD